MGPDGTDKGALLSQIAFFKGCTQRQVDDIAKLAEDRQLNPGEMLCQQGDFESEVFVIVQGEAAAFINDTQVGSVGAGEVVGEMSMLGSGRRVATLKATTPLHVLVLDPQEVDSVLASDPGSSKRLGPHKSGD